MKGPSYVTSRPASLFKNIIFNVGGYAASILVTFLIAPFTIHTLGDARYGAWSLVGELVGYYGLLDLGIRGAVTYYVARHTSKDEHAYTKETIGTAFWILAASGAIVFLAGLVFVIIFPHVIKTGGLSNLTEVRAAFLIMSVLIAVSLPMSTFAAVLGGRQRFDLDTIAEVLTRIFTAIGVYVVLKAGHGLVALALVQCIARIGYWALTVILVRKVTGGVFVNPRWFSRERVRALTGYGGRNLVTNISQVIIRRLDLVVVGAFVGVASVTHYSIGSSLVSYAITFCSTVVFAFTPRFTELYARESHDQLEALYLSGIRMAGMLIAGLCAGILIFGRIFIHLWVGNAYVSGPWTERSDVVMAILVVSNLPRMLQSVSWQLLFASAKVKFLMWMNIWEAVANLCLSLVLVHWFELAGVALGTLVPMLVTQGIVMPLYISRTFQISIGRFVRKGLLMPLLAGLTVSASSLTVLFVLPPRTWHVFFPEALGVVLTGAIFFVAVGITGAERSNLLKKFGLAETEPSTIAAGGLD
jgi:O-antigen/teichoic acid export membrane protein